MMSTLLTQEFRSTRRLFATAFGLMLLVALVSFATNALRIPVVGGIGFVLGLLVTAMFVPVALALLAACYWRTMYGREGYFTMSIPVRGRTLYASKTLFGLAVALVAAALTLVGGAVGFASFTMANAVPLADGVAQLRETLSVVDASALWFAAASVLVNLVYIVVAGSALMTIGAEGRFNRLGFGAPVIGGALLYVVMQVLGLAAMLFLPFGMRLTGPDAGAFVAQGMWSDFVVAIEDGGSTEPGVIGLGMLPLSILVTALLAWWAVRSVERRTSLR